MLHLKSAHQQSKLKSFMSRIIMAPKLLEIDEIGYLPFGREETNFIYLVCFIKIVNKNWCFPEK